MKNHFNQLALLVLALLLMACVTNPLISNEARVYEQEVLTIIPKDPIGVISYQDALLKLREHIAIDDYLNHDYIVTVLLNSTCWVCLNTEDRTRMEAANLWLSDTLMDLNMGDKLDRATMSSWLSDLSDRLRVVSDEGYSYRN